MELEELVGEHWLDAVDFSNEQVESWGERFEDCQVVRFRLDGVCYTALEDPDDGYRSRMKDLFIGEEVVMTNVFPPLRVVARYRTDWRFGCEDFDHHSDILELIDTITGEIVLEVGTEDVADYYPAFVACFHPEVMAHNHTKR